MYAAVPSNAPLTVSGFSSASPDQAEVEELDAPAGDHQLPRLEVAMDDARSVSGDETPRDLTAQLGGVGRRCDSARGSGRSAVDVGLDQGLAVQATRQLRPE